MQVNGVILRKLEIIDETVRKLRELGDVTSARLEADFFLKKGIERALQICVEAVTDVAHRLVALEGRPPSSTAGKALDAIASMGAIVSAAAYRPMVQFRNIVVHRYEIVDNEILLGILRCHLDDFQRFMDEIRGYVARQS